MELVKSKSAGGQPVISKAPERGNVVNLMDALGRSIVEERRPAAPSLAKAAGSARAGAKKAEPKVVAAKPVEKKKKSSAA